MDLYIYTPENALLGIVDTASSVIWANRYRECGEFEIYIPASAEMLDLLQIDRLVAREDDEMAGIIERVEISTDEEDGDYLTVKGRCLRSIFDRRIIWNQTSLTGNLENGLRKLITEAIVSPEIAERKISNFRLADAHGYTETIDTQYTGTNLLEAVEELCGAFGYGFKVTREDGDLVCDFYKGVDRTAGQSDLPRVIFSEEFDNLKTSLSARDKTNYKTVALVAGEGEGTARRRVTVIRSDAASGLDRREMFVDARDISSNDGEISEADYNLQLAARGNTDLSAAALVETVEGSIEAEHMFRYRIDYNLGDMVTVINRYGIETDAQVLEVVEVEDANGRTCSPTFG